MGRFDRVLVVEFGGGCLSWFPAYERRHTPLSKASTYAARPVGHRRTRDESIVETHDSVRDDNARHIPPPHAGNAAPPAESTDPDTLL